jgi:hypothetical protein
MQLQARADHGFDLRGNSFKYRANSDCCPAGAIWMTTSTDRRRDDSPVSSKSFVMMKA